MAGPTTASRALGRELARLRGRAKMTITAASKVVETSPPTMRRLEDGVKVKITNLWINALSDAYGCDEKERKMLFALAAEVLEASKSGGSWWRAYADTIGDFSQYISLESAANSLTTWASALTPGLLQASDYRREIAWVQNPSWSHDEVERSVEVAERRQERLKDPKFRVEVILAEAVLRNRIGSPAVMAAQLEKLIEISEMPGNSVRVVPFATPNPIGSYSGRFTLLEFPDLEQTRMSAPPVVYVEEFTGDLFLEREVEIWQYREALERIKRVALTTTETRSLVEKVMKEHL